MKLNILRHFQSFFGVNQLVLSRGGVDVYRWAHPSNKGDVVLTTVGMAKELQLIPDGKNCISSAPRTEVMMFCNPINIGSVAPLLIDIADYPKKAKSFIHWWHVLPLGGSIVPNSQLCNVFFTFPPFDGKFATLESNDSRIDILWAIPISDGERTIFESKGTEVLEQQMEERDVVVSDFLRLSIAEHA